MKDRFLQLKRVLRAALLILLLSVAGMIKAYASYNFSAVCPTGQTLYYIITDATNHYVALSCPGEPNYYNCWSGYTKPTGEINLPENVGYNGISYTVTSIGNYAFYQCSGLTGSLVIPNSVTMIGEMVFSGCSGFTGSLTIPNSVITIDDNAFSGCSGFTDSLTIPNSVTTIGGSAFTGCTGFTGSLTISNSVTEIGGYAFCGCSGFTGSLTIGNSVTTLGAGTFYGCSGFTGSLVIPNSVTTIYGFDDSDFDPSTGAFRDCSGFTSLTLSNSLTMIGGETFADCSGLTGNVDIPNSVTIIGYGAFYNCSGLTSFSLPNSVSSIGSYAFTGTEWYNNQPDNTIIYLDGCCIGYKGSTPSGNLQIIEGTRLIAGAAFRNCYGFTGSLVIPNTITEIGEEAFYGCSGFTGNLTIGNSVTTIGKGAFSGCNGFTGNLIIPNSVTTIGLYCEYGTSSDWGAFYGCSGFTGDLIIPNSVTTIGNTSFESCTGFIGTLTIPNSVTKIGPRAFFDCSGFTGNLTLPNTITKICYSTFEGCSGFNGSLIIPNSVTWIDKYAFHGCSGFTSIFCFAETPPTFYYDNPFSNWNFNIPVYVPCGFIEAYASVSWGGFSNFIEMCGGTVTVSANPEEGGTVTGGGTFEYGMGPQTCTLTATANEGYTFMYWKEDDEIVSSDTTFSFIVQGNRVLVAHFALPFTISATANPVDDGTVSGGGAYDYGTTCTLTAVANEGYHFVNWTKAGEEISTEAVYSFTVTEDGDYVANFELNTYEITATVNPEAGGMVTGAGTYSHGETATLTATANENYIFVNWTQDGEEVSTETSYSFEVTEDLAFVANFELNTYEIIVTANPAEAGEVTGAGIYNHGETATLTATPNQGYHFVNWTKDGEEVSTDAEYSFTVTESGDYVANFALNIYLIAVGANPEEGGTVTSDGTSWHFGDPITLTAVPNPSYVFVNWTKDGEVVSTDPVYSFLVTESAVYSANFELESYTITAMANPTEGGEVTGAGTYTHGETATLTATANEGYTFVNWTRNGAVVSTEAEYNFTVTEEAIFTATFTLNSYAITATANPSEGGMVTGGGTYYHFENATLTAIANEGYTFVNWTRNGAVVSTEAEYNFTVTEEAIFTATFTLNSYAITATANPTIGGTVTGGGTYYHFETATLTATPSAGYRFVNWTKDGAAISANQTLNIMVTEAANYVANFETYSYNITALANPSVGGTVTGAGTYEFGETATLTATPNANYAFVNWTENGVEVSTEDIYSFIVTGSRSLVANFSHDYYWTVNPFAHESTMTIIGIVQINGEEQHSNLLEVGAFSGEECRGREWLTDQYYVDLGHYLVFLTVYGDDDSADEITFRLYDHAVGEEIDKTCVTTLFFETDAIYGSNADPFALNFIDENVAQTTNFNNGWNWWSSFIELDGANSLQSLENSLGTNGMMIKSQNDGYASYLEGFGWYGSLTTINNESTYQIRANEACTVEMTGSVANPAEHPIELHSGWTWVGYPVAVSMGVEDALAGISPLSGDMLKSQNDGFASYLEGFGWYGSLSFLNPGMGLMYKSNNSSPITLVYPNNGTRTDLKPNQTSENNHWRPNLNAYPDNMSVMAVVELDGNELEGENYELAAFANGDVRGSARLLYVAPIDRYIAFLTVAGDEATEIRFGLYDAETGEACLDSDNAITYETNAVIGSFAEPYVVRFRGNTGVAEWANSLNVFPNPVERGQKVSLGFNDVEMGEVQVEIINVLGTIVETRRAASLQTITAPETAGVYTLRITVEGKGTCYRKLVVE